MCRLITTVSQITIALLCCITAAHAEDHPPGWTATRTLAAPEAHQAAAADDQFVYAIASSTIAKYDRSTGERIAVSTGEAQHLNSGFLWKGQLLCAHSNYPKLPEQSQIKSLDRSTMRLTTLHDFGSYGGSLTWVVRHDDHWWCNFARYGEHNHETFLVTFDDDWNEQARFTYPESVVKQLRTSSLSGGLWLDNRLLVTGHDDPVVFRLKLPQNGSVLELVNTQSVPFTGQGFAIDPQGGGLVGINRAKRQLIFAEWKSR